MEPSELYPPPDPPSERRPPEDPGKLEKKSANDSSKETPETPEPAKYSVVFLGGAVKYNLAVTNLETQESALIQVGGVFPGHEEKAWGVIAEEWAKFKASIEAGNADPALLQV